MFERSRSWKLNVERIARRRPIAACPTSARALARLRVVPVHEGLHQATRPASAAASHASSTSAAPPRVGASPRARACLRRAPSSSTRGGGGSAARCRRRRARRRRAAPRVARRSAGSRARSRRPPRPVAVAARDRRQLDLVGAAAISISLMFAVERRPSFTATPARLARARAAQVRRRPRRRGR